MTLKPLSLLKRVVKFGLYLVRTLFTLSLHTVIVVTLVILSSILALKLPEMHNIFLREFVGSRMYYIVNARGGGGTGFQIRTKSGKDYLLTNDHVCKGTEDSGVVMVKLEDGRLLPRRVIEHSRYTDLCLVEGMPGVIGLSLATYMPYMGQTLYVIGHPLLRPMTVTYGEFEGQDDVTVIDHEILPDQPEDCSLPKQKVDQLEFNFLGISVGKTMVCEDITKAAYLTNITIFPGNSGSPTVDWTGRVVGVAFATDMTNWARVVSLKDIQTFLDLY